MSLSAESNTNWKYHKY